MNKKEWIYKHTPPINKGGLGIKRVSDDSLQYFLISVYMAVVISPIKLLILWAVRILHKLTVYDATTTYMESIEFRQATFHSHNLYSLLSVQKNWDFNIIYRLMQNICPCTDLI